MRYPGVDANKGRKRSVNIDKPTGKRVNAFVKIIVPLLIGVTVFGTWVYKNYTHSQSASFSGVIEQGFEKNTDPTVYALNVTAPIDLEALKALQVPILIDFGADSCIPCKEMAPVLSELNETLTGKAIVKFVDVRKNKDLSSGFPINVIPTQVLFSPDGKPYSPSDEISQTIRFSIYKDKSTGEHVFTTHQGGLTKEQIRSIFVDMGMVLE
jgi:thioredoxin 1